MQHLLSRARVDEPQLLESAADWPAAHLTAGQDEGDEVLIVDETADAKSSADCAAATRQYSGTVGGIAMCQVAVTLACASPAGHALIGRALYLPADWAADESGTVGKWHSIVAGRLRRISEDGGRQSHPCDKQSLTPALLSVAGCSGWLAPGSGKRRVAALAARPVIGLMNRSRGSAVAEDGERGEYES